MAIFSKEEQESIRIAIESAEKETSGEIRICVEKTCSEDVLDRTANYFSKLGMDKTAQRNGVLIYMAIEDRKFAIIGDAGINKAVPDNFWDTTKEAMLDHFKEGRMAEGIIIGIKLAGEQLAAYFPCLDDDKNELSDDIDYGEGN